MTPTDAILTTLWCRPVYRQQRKAVNTAIELLEVGKTADGEWGSSFVVVVHTFDA